MDSIIHVPVSDSKMGSTRSQMRRQKPFRGSSEFKGLDYITARPVNIDTTMQHRLFSNQPT
jgi:hypothetical protein